MFRLSLITLAIILASCNLSYAQLSLERLNSDITFLSTVTSSKNQSFWLSHNRWGIFDDASANALSLITNEIETRKDKLFDFGGGISLLARGSNSSTIYLHQAYAEAKLGFIHLTAGRKAYAQGISFSDLSSGTVALSQNAMPIPRLTISVPEFWEIPFSFGWLEIRGHLSHGWLNDDRYVTMPYIHDKSIHLQTGDNTGFKFYWGLNHIAIWGGESPTYGKLPSSFSDLILVAQAKGGNEDAPSGDQINALGFHTGVWDWGLRGTIGRTSFHLFYQHLFTDGSGQGYRNAGDGFFGLSIDNLFPFSWINGLTYEYLNTTDQTGPGLSDDIPGATYPCDEINCGFPFGGRDNYYNNGIYRSGHSYSGMSLGTPFFFTQNQLNKIDSEIKTYGSVFFVSTRNIAHHFGVKGDISEDLSYKMLLSNVKYYGTYSGLNQGTTWGILDPANNIVLEDYFFYPYKKQWYFLFETHWQLKGIHQLQLTTSLAIDKGELFNNIGIMLGATWTLSPTIKSHNSQ
jgi:hypothetical protein